MKTFSILRPFLIVAFSLMAVSCDTESDSVRTERKSYALMKTFVGSWQGQSKQMGGQGLAQVEIRLKADRTFEMDVVVAEKAHTFNAYPTLDRIRMAGQWSMDDALEIMLDGEVTEFLRTQRIGDAVHHGFLPDNTRSQTETRLVPLPFEYDTTLFVTRDGNILLDSIEFRGREADRSDTNPESRMVVQVTMRRNGE